MATETESFKCLWILKQQAAGPDPAGVGSGRGWVPQCSGLKVLVIV